VGVAVFWAGAFGGLRGGMRLGEGSKGRWWSSSQGPCTCRQPGLVVMKWNAIFDGVVEAFVADVAGEHCPLLS